MADAQQASVSNAQQHKSTGTPMRMKIGEAGAIITAEEGIRVRHNQENADTTQHTTKQHPSSTQAAPKQHQQHAPLRRPCSLRARLHSPPNYGNKTQCENTQKQSRQSCVGAYIYITRRRIFWRAKLWAQAQRERGAWMAAGQRTRREGREFQGCHCRCCRRRRMARGQGASFCARCWAD
jgi:hypothetical protein